MADFSWAQFWMTAATSVVSVAAGVRIARYQFDLERHRGEQQAAAALLADLNRIDANLGKSANAFGSSFAGMTFEPPKLHRWSEPVVIQLAAVDPRIIEGCMDLDRLLNNFGAMVARFHLTARAQEEAREEVRRLAADATPDDAPMNELVARAGEKVTAEYRVKEMAEAVREAITGMRDPHTQAKARIAELRGYISTILKASAPEFIPVPEDEQRS